MRNLSDIQNNSLTMKVIADIFWSSGRGRVPTPGEGAAAAALWWRPLTDTRKCENRYVLPLYQYPFVKRISNRYLVHTASAPRGLAVSRTRALSRPVASGATLARRRPRRGPCRPRARAPSRSSPRRAPAEQAADAAGEAAGGPSGSPGGVASDAGSLSRGPASSPPAATGTGLHRGVRTPNLPTKIIPAKIA